MITAIFAVGPQGQFGKGNGLPWECKADLEGMYADLKRLRPNIILVGARTYKSLPLSVIKKISTACNTPNLWSSSKEETKAPPEWHVYSRGPVPQKEGHTDNFGVILEISESLEKYYEGVNVVCLGGAGLLEHLFDYDLIDQAIVTHIRLNKDHESKPKPITYEGFRDEKRCIYNQEDADIHNALAQHQWEQDAFVADTIVDNSITEYGKTRILMQQYFEPSSKYHYNKELWVL
jgi:dihydrofolate reductase